MCGIVGFTGTNNRYKLNSLLSLIEHRGRDGRSCYSSRDIQMGMNRLAIIDLSPNLYPMRYKHYVLVFNGEIYNFNDLKLRLQSQGVHFKTKSDAEVILPLFYRYGPKAFDMFEGMFAICIYDTKKHQIILARDKSGEKPLYVTQTQSGIVFASEIKVLLSIPDVLKKIDYSGLPHYLTHGFVCAPDTLIKNIKKIPPACYVVYEIKTKRLHTYPYWKPVRQHSRLSSDAIAKNEQTLDGLLRKSVGLRLVADVPVGCFLSGGMDSSLITYYASHVKPNIHTYSISFPHHGEQDESQYALYVAKRLQTRHTQIECTSKAVYELFNNIETFIDEPIIDPAVLPTLLLAKEARKTVKVVLTGEGADELFGGYTRYAGELVKEFVHRRVTPFSVAGFFWRTAFRNKFQHVLQNLQDRYSPQHAWTHKELTGLLGYHPSPRAQNSFVHFAYTNPLLFMQLTDYRGYMAEQLLNKIDKSTMARNLEARAPYLDSSVINFAFSLPNNQKIRFLQGKYILKKVAQRYFPLSFVWRPKHGFDVPLADWFRKDLKPLVYQSLESLSFYRELFHIDYYQKIITDHMENRSDNANKIWSMVVLGNWLTRHKITV